MFKKREIVIYWELERTFVTLNSTAAASDADTHTVCVRCVSVCVCVRLCDVIYYLS